MDSALRPLLLELVYTQWETVEKRIHAQTVYVDHGPVVWDKNHYCELK